MGIRQSLSIISDVIGFNPYDEVKPNEYKRGRPAITDIWINAQFDVRFEPALKKQFNLMNYYYRRAYKFARRMMNSKSKSVYLNMLEKRDEANNQAYILVTNFETEILRWFKDQTCHLTENPIAVVPIKDLVTNQGLNTIVENFMLFGTGQNDTMEIGSGQAPPFGGDKALETIITSTSISQFGFRVPYGIEARHGAPFLASVATSDIGEVGIKDSILGRYYARAVFPADKVIEHITGFDVYSILHISLFKAV